MIFIWNPFWWCPVLATDAESVISHHLSGCVGRENPPGCHICRSDPLFHSELSGASVDQNLILEPERRVSVGLKQKLGLNGELLVIIGRLMGVKWELFITPSPPRPTSTRLRRSTYLWRKSSWQLSPMSSSFSTVSFIYTQGEKTNKSVFFFFLSSLKKREKSCWASLNKMPVTEGKGGRRGAIGASLVH